MKRSLSFCVLLGMLLCGCAWVSNEDAEKTVLAKVGDKVLYLEDVSNQLLPPTSTEDSIMQLTAIARDWIERQVLLQQAELNLIDSNRAFDRALQQYKEQLIVYHYESQLIAQKLDTNISIAEIEQYYNAHQQDFELKDFILKLRYIKLYKNAPKREETKRMLFTPSLNEIEKLEDYCFQFAANYLLDESIWLYFDEILKEIPIRTLNPEQFLRQTKSLELEDEEYIYWLYIVDYRLKNDLSPLEFEQEKIKQIILNQRKLDLITALRQNMVENALNKSEAQILVSP